MNLTHSYHCYVDNSCVFSARMLCDAFASYEVIISSAQTDAVRADDDVLDESHDQEQQGPSLIRCPKCVLQDVQS